MGSGEEDREVQEAHVQGADVVPRGVVAAHLDWDVAEGCSLQVDSPALFRYTVFCLQSPVEDHWDGKSCNRQIRRSFTLKNRCLVSSLAARCILKRRKIKSRIFLGLAKEFNGKMIAHAWLKNRESRNSC